MEYSEITEEAIGDAMMATFVPPRRGITVYTGAGGMDEFEMAMESFNGLTRRRMPKKIARIFSKGVKISITGYKYKLVKS